MNKSGAAKLGIWIGLGLVLVGAALAGFAENIYFIRFSGLVVAVGMTLISLSRIQ